MKVEKDYLDRYKKEFEDGHSGMTVDNHQQHNADPEYWDMLLGPVKSNPDNWKGKRAFDFGCGCGRNLKNLLDLAEWDLVYGCDISKSNAKYAKEWTEGYYPGKAHTWESMGADIQPCEENSFDFIMSHIVMQHISNYSVRYSILTDMYKCLKTDGLVSLHYLDMNHSSFYHEESNTYQNCRVENPQYLINDFEKIGFKNVTCDTGRDPFTGQTTYYIKGYK